ncbi:murein hydrolase activator EnvC family protein [Wolbachia endosymbiont of Dirofilaria (Dirofilaria) immitis]|uniref:murein hydrolase activator EnvC family protein n=1 Tax=Wolbachia endosymbiont of Dirofilaria (Dirofilaria) immitis TaxID=1812115 RepID=UPI00158F1934|nr:M23 family metallopeptidase [Wolbachia endosymbiont of Dirofilaria (Dirofilaria) immitis]QKX02118.1 peptidoglycan DD-metalloendopeptidase family protein [Wolbachia endosymbiont of Dirofilaria (Dirofilaria) immitis]
MWRIASLFILQVILVSCSLQKPAPVLLKGEEFYGKRDLEYTREYHLIKKDTNSLIKKENRKDIVNRTHRNKNDTQNVKINRLNCKFMMPVKGTSVSFDEACKDGIKITAQSGTSVVASAPGKIIYVGKGLRWYGNLIIVEHKDNYMTAYSYLKNINVKIGDKVKQGQVIGSAGKLSTQDKYPQICFIIRCNGQTIDPLSHTNCNET